MLNNIADLGSSIRFIGDFNSKFRKNVNLKIIENKNLLDEVKSIMFDYYHNE